MSLNVKLSNFWEIETAPHGDSHHENTTSFRSVMLHSGSQPRRWRLVSTPDPGSDTPDFTLVKNRGVSE